MRPDAVRDLVKRLATEAGFDSCGVARAQRLERSHYLRWWLDSGFAGTMYYLHRNVNTRTDPRRLVPGAESIVVTSLQYLQRPPARCAPEEDPVGRVAMYAWGEDYHRVVRDKLHVMVDRMRKEIDEPFEAKCCVDTVPLLEREWAAAAGVGWIGKNTLVLNRRQGSYFFLSAIVTTLDIAPDAPGEDHCGSCTACLRACPTDAFPGPYRMDASRCISYLTIEHRGDISRAFQEKMGGWIFGCDECQAVCPYNRDAAHTSEPRFAVSEPGPRPPLTAILKWSEEDYRRVLRRSAIRRASLEMLKRNVRITFEHGEASNPRSHLGPDQDPL